ncbi:MAG: ABC transporter permease [Planctomycetota bacterium]|jgi:lipopolysaccharide transport system permease protein
MSDSTLLPKDRVPVIQICPHPQTPLLNLREIRQFSELFWALSLRNLAIRYKQTAAGITWAFLKPFITVMILTVVFQYILGIGTEGAPLYLVIYAGVLPWSFFGGTLTQASISFVGNANILGKVYFPRILLPASSYLPNTVDFTVSFACFSVLYLINGFIPSARLLLLPLFMIMTMLLSFSLGLIFGIANVRFRDVQFVVPYLLQLGLYISPIAYTSDRIPTAWQWAYYLNPMAGIIDGIRWCLFPELHTFSLLPLLMGTAISLLLLFVALYVYRILDASLVDEI